MEFRRRKFCIKLVCAAVLACLFSIGLNSAALAESDKLTVRVMTRNVDAGTDLNYVAGISDPAAFIAGLLATVAEVDDSRIPERAARLAEEITAAKPDLIALQEVTTWSIIDTQGPRIYDQLALLMDALDARGQHYKVEVLQSLADIPVPVAQFAPGIGLTYIRFTDQNAILVRSDLPPGHLKVIGTETHLYQNILGFDSPLGLVQIPNGWMAVDVKIRGARFKFANTHLLSVVPKAVSVEAFYFTSAVQQAQAQELLLGLSATSLPVIFAGDFNSDAEIPQHDPDSTPTAEDIRSAGYADIWHLLHGDDPGYTWPLFFEDQARIFNPTSPFERIDLIFSGGPAPLAIQRTGTEPGPGPAGVYASDHVGVVADFDLENHRPDVPKRKK